MHIVNYLDGSSEVISETARANGSCSLSLPLDLVVHEATATLAERSRSVESVESGENVRCGNARTSQSSFALVR